MPKARKMVSLNIEETSGVDHPAHLTEGWLVIKSEDSDVSNLLSDLTKQETVLDTSSTNEGTEEEPMPQDEATPTVDATAEVVTTDNADVEKGKAENMADAQARIAELEKELANYKEEMDKLKGKKIALVYHDSPFGKEPIPLLQERSRMHGFELQMIPVTAPGVEQKAAWLQVRQSRPDLVIS